MAGEPAPGGAAMAADAYMQAAADVAIYMATHMPTDDTKPDGLATLTEIAAIIARHLPAPPESGMREALEEARSFLDVPTYRVGYAEAHEGVCARIDAALSAAPAEDGWRDISTAPKDGTRVLLRRMIDTTKFPNLPEIGWIKVGKWVADWQDGYEEAWREDAVPRVGRESAIRLSPTDWQPLPASRPGGRR